MRVFEMLRTAARVGPAGNSEGRSSSLPKLRPYESEKRCFFYKCRIDRGFDIRDSVIKARFGALKRLKFSSGEYLRGRRRIQRGIPRAERSRICINSHGRRGFPYALHSLAYASGNSRLLPRNGARKWKYGIVRELILALPLPLA